MDITFTSDIFVGIGTLILAGIAWKGLETWKREFHHRKKAHLAEEILTYMEDLFRKINKVRSAYLEELESRSIQNNTDKSISYQEKFINIYQDRFNNIIEDINNIGGIAVKTKMYFGQDLYDKFNKYFEQINEISILIDKIKAAAFLMAQFKDTREYTSDFKEQFTNYNNLMTEFRTYDYKDNITICIRKIIDEVYDYIEKTLKIR